MLNFSLNFSVKYFSLNTLIILIIFLAYWPTVDNQFITSWDDNKYIIENPHITAFTGDNLIWMMTSFHASTWHPLTWLSHTLDYTLFGLHPKGPHLTNLLFHSLNAIWLFWLTVILLNIVAGRPLRSLQPATVFAATVAALWFGLHPQHVESVAWISSRKDLLCLFFLFPTLLAYLCYVTTSTTAPHHWYWYGLALVSFGLALLSKPMAVTLPAILLLLDIYPLRRTSLTLPLHATGQLPRSSYRWLLLEKLPFFAFSVVVIVLTLAAVQTHQALTDLSMIGWSDRLLTVGHNLIFYLSKLFLPVSFAAFYPFQLESNSWLFLLVVGLVFLVSAYAWSRQQYYPLTIWLFYLITFSPVIGFFQFGVPDAMADRYVYLPTLPFYSLVGAGLAHLFYNKMANHRGLKFSLVVLLLVISATLFGLTRAQTATWKNDVTLWTHAIEHTDNNYFAYTKLGTVYVQQGHYQLGIEQLVRSWQLNYSYYPTYQNLAVAYILTGQLPAALFFYQQIIEHFPQPKHLDEIYYNMAMIYFDLGKIKDSRIFVEQAISLNPRHLKAQQLLSTLKGED